MRQMPPTQLEVLRSCADIENDWYCSVRESKTTINSKSTLTITTAAELASGVRLVDWLECYFDGHGQEFLFATRHLETEATSGGLRAVVTLVKYTNLSDVAAVIRAPSFIHSFPKKDT